MRRHEPGADASPRRNRRWGFWWVLGTVLAMPMAGAQSAGPPPSPLTTFKLAKADCVNGFVSKSRLGKKLANVAGLVGPISAYLAAQPNEASHLYAHLYGDPGLCSSLGCDSADADALGHAREWLDGRLRLGQGSDFTRGTSDTDATRFFSTPDAEDGIACAVPPGHEAPVVAATPGLSPPIPPRGQAAAPAPPVGAPAAIEGQEAQVPTPGPPGVWDLSHFRVRGYAEQIPLPRATGAGPPVDSYHTDVLFDTTQGASINYKYSGQNKTDQGSIIGTIGYEFSLESLMGQALQTAIPETFIVPYFGVDRENTTKPTGTPPKPATQFSTNFIDFGFAATAYLRQAPPTDIKNTGPWDLTGHLFTLQPQYLENYIDGSEKVSLNFRYIPLTAQYINTYGYPIASVPNLKAALIADLRFNNGWFVHKGVPIDPSINQNYVRVGGRVGAALEYIIGETYPVDLATYYTDFYPLSGFRKSLGEFEALLVLNFGENKLLNLTLQYANGRREDTTQRYNAWTAGISLHY